MEVINTIKTYNDETKNQVRSEINRQIIQIFEEFDIKTKIDDSLSNILKLTQEERNQKVSKFIEMHKQYCEDGVKFLSKQKNLEIISFLNQRYTDYKNSDNSQKETDFYLIVALLDLFDQGQIHVPDKKFTIQEQLGFSSDKSIGIYSQYTNKIIQLKENTNIPREQKESSIKKQEELQQIFKNKFEKKDYSDSYTIRFLTQQELKNCIPFVLGGITSCCLNLGATGGNFCLYSMLDPNANFAVVEHNGKVIFHSLACLSEDRKTLYFDTIDPTAGMRQKNQNITGNLTTFLYNELAEQIVKDNSSIENVVLSIAGNTIEAFSGQEIPDNLNLTITNQINDLQVSKIEKEKSLFCDYSQYLKPYEGEVNPASSTTFSLGNNAVHEVTLQQIPNLQHQCFLKKREQNIEKIVLNSQKKYVANFKERKNEINSAYSLQY